MQYAKLGRTGLKVSRLCLGTNMFGASYVPDERAISVVHEAYQQGINFIDTADMYHSGRSEEIVGRAVQGHRHHFVIATKVFFPMGPGVNDRGLSRKHLIEGVEGSLRRLNTDYIDLYQVHYWDPETPLEETLRTLDDLVRLGKIRYIGCSHFAAWQLCKALWTSDKYGLQRFESIQPEYHFRCRGIEEELFPLCQDQQVSVLAYQVLMGGLLAATYSLSSEPRGDSHMASLHAESAKKNYWNEGTFQMVDRLKLVAADAGYEPAAIALAWALSRPAVTSLVVGSSRPQQITRNAAAITIKLSPDVLQQLDSL